MKQYDHLKIEKKWQKKWAEERVYETLDTDTKPKQYILDMFPYPSGEGLHVGHPRGYIATDVYSRKKRMEGYSVLHPMGWDAFGLPAENFAIKNKIHPRVAVEKNVARFKEQLSLIGLDYDWSREVNTTDPAFYKWTQWIFLQMYKKGLAYESNEPVNWCPADKTVLANEDVESDGTCERCGTKVEKRPMRQWVLKITEYADRMLADLDKLPKWPDGVKEAQRNWIGRSEGSEIYFNLNFTTQPELNENRDKNGNRARLPVFTTRADTLFGATYLVLAPEHPWVTLALDENHKGVIDNESEVRAYIETAKEKTEVDRTNVKKEKTGIEIKGVRAINPITGGEIPVWVADYVLAGYGTGAIMAVPAHDERDFEFAKKYSLPVQQVIMPTVFDTKNPIQEGKENTNRATVHVILRNPKDKTVLIQFLKGEKWKGNEPVNFIIGGIEEGENEIDTAIREIREETGYTNVSFVEKVPFEVQANFFAAHKDVNRTIHIKTLVFDLEGDEKIEIEEDEYFTKDSHEMKWVPYEEVAETLTIPDDRMAWNYFYNGSFPYSGEGILINSGEFNGINSQDARTKITEAVGGKTVNTYRIKDWVFSRQRYWGEPIPIIHCKKCGVVPVPEKDLPILLPEVEQYEPTGTGESPLAAIEAWVNTTCPACGGVAKRETNTMPQWAGSSWYYLRFIDPANDEVFIDLDKEKKWMPVDVYVGGDHATRHLIYARFWHKFLYDIGVVSTEEPFPRLEFLGFILAEDGRKMSKRWKNVINPDDMIIRFGADAFRLYEMFIGPFESTTPWNTNGLVGTYRFLEKVWGYFETWFKNRADDFKAKDGDKFYLTGTNEQIEPLLQKTIKKVTEDIEEFKFNTAVSSMMILMNELRKETKGLFTVSTPVSDKQMKIILSLLAPFAPHMAEELWHELGETESIHHAPWPLWDESKIIEENVSIVVQINGKVRAELLVRADMSEEEVQKLAINEPKIIPWIEGKEIKRIVSVRGRLVNIVI